MKLTPAQHEQFERDGYLFFPGHFTAEEARTLTDAVPALYSRREDYNVREKGKDAVRTNFAAHLYSEPFARLARHPRMVGPVQELLGEQLYMHRPHHARVARQPGERLAVEGRGEVGSHRVFAFFAHVVEIGRAHV